MNKNDSNILYYVLLGLIAILFCLFSYNYGYNIGYDVGHEARIFGYIKSSNQYECIGDISIDDSCYITQRNGSVLNGCLTAHIYNITSGNEEQVGIISVGDEIILSYPICRSEYDRFRTLEGDIYD